MDPGRPVRPAGPGRDQLRSGGPAAGPPARGARQRGRHGRYPFHPVSVPVQLNPVLAEMRPYPFLALDDARQRALPAGRALIDFSVGEPHEATDAGIRQALVDAVQERSSYPKAEGLPELKEAIAAWCERRYGVVLDPGSEVVPTLGSKEAVFSLPFIAMDPHGRRDTVVGPEPAARVERLPARPGRGPALDLGEGGHRLGQLPEQPDGRGGAGLLLSGPGAQGRAPWLPGRVGRGLQRDLLQRAAGLGDAGAGPLPDRVLQHPEQALLDDRLSDRVRRRPARADPWLQAVAAAHRRP